MPRVAMAHPSDPTAPPAPASQATVPSDETADRGRVAHDQGASEAEDAHYEHTDPHPDTPDDFDEDASVARQSVEGLPEDDD